MGRAAQADAHLIHAGSRVAALVEGDLVAAGGQQGGAPQSASVGDGHAGGEEGGRGDGYPGAFNNGPLLVLYAAGQAAGCGLGHEHRPCGEHERHS